jgi:flagellar motor switch protein FliN
MQNPPDIAFFYDVPLEVRATLECGSLAVGEILKLSTGSVLQTARAAGDNVNIQVGQAIIGAGEIIVVGAKVGCRISDFEEKK